MADVGRASIRRGGAEYCLMHNVSVHGLKLLFVIFFEMDSVFQSINLYTYSTIKNAILPTLKCLLILILFKHYLIPCSLFA